MNTVVCTSFDEENHENIIMIGIKIWVCTITLNGRLGGFNKLYNKR